MSFARVRALAVVGALVLAAIIFVTVALVKDKQSGPAQAQGCAKDAVMANITLPEEQDVKINVYNATDKPGLASEMKNEFTNRKFKVIKSGNDPAKKPVAKVAAAALRPQVGRRGLAAAGLLPQRGRPAVRHQAHRRRRRRGDGHRVQAAGHHHRGAPGTGPAGQPGPAAGHLLGLGPVSWILRVRGEVQTANRRRLDPPQPRKIQSQALAGPSR